MRNKILIYSDYGSSDLSSLQRSLNEYFAHLGVSIRTTTAEEIIKKNSLNEEVLAFFMPGGRATPYLQKLQTQGNQKIAEYVENGGIYFGICAGAYYASRQVMFETDIKDLEIKQQCGLNLIEADAIGTLYKELEISPYSNDLHSITATELCWLSDKGHHITNYHGGPYFKLYSETKVKVLAEYILKSGNLPAIVMQSHGKGAAIASGVHIEDSGAVLRHIMQYNMQTEDKRIRRVIKQLEEAEESRQALFGKLMCCLKVR